MYGDGIFNPLGSVLAEINGFFTLKISPIKLLIEGLFNGNVMVSDTVKIELRFYAQPYNLLDSAVVLIDCLGSAAAEFNNIKLNENFYIVIKHRNSIETWSRLPQVFNTGVISYDFTIDSSQAYGNNMVYKNDKWCIYSGDVNQDGAIDSTDLMLVFYENVSGSTGYIQSDLNGDMFCEIEDLIIVYLNFIKNIFCLIPQ